MHTAGRCVSSVPADGRPGPGTRNQELRTAHHLRTTASQPSAQVSSAAGAIAGQRAVAGSPRAAVAQSANSPFGRRRWLRINAPSENQGKTAISHLSAPARADAFWGLPGLPGPTCPKPHSRALRALYGAILPTAWVSPATGFYGPSCASKNTVSFRQDRSRTQITIRRTLCPDLRFIRYTLCVGSVLVLASCWCLPCTSMAA